tara:strand:+ start:67 stop:1350 length:1284 start_codon:yes stop_codon:yes gene_type:complete
MVESINFKNKYLKYKLKYQKLIGGIKLVEIKQDAEEAYQQKDYDEALVLFKLIIKRYPKNENIIYALRYLGSIYFKKNDYIKGLETYIKILELKPNDTSAKDNINKIQQNLGLRRPELKISNQTQEFQSAIPEQKPQPLKLEQGPVEYQMTEQEMRRDEVFKNQDLANKIGTHRIKLVLQLFEQFINLVDDIHEDDYSIDILLLYLKKKLDKNEYWFLDLLIDNNNYENKEEIIDLFNEPSNDNYLEEILLLAIKDYDDNFKKYEDVFINQINLIKYLLNYQGADADYNNVEDNLDNGTLAHAIYKKNIEILELLISNGANYDINITDDGFNPLIDAIHTDNPEIFKIVLDLGGGGLSSDMYEHVFYTIFQNIMSSEQNYSNELNNILKILVEFCEQMDSNPFVEANRFLNKEEKKKYLKFFVLINL